MNDADPMKVFQPLEDLPHDAGDLVQVGLPIIDEVLEAAIAELQHQSVATARSNEAPVSLDDVGMLELLGHVDLVQDLKLWKNSQCYC